MAEQNAPKLVQDTAEPVAPPTPGLDAPMRATAERLVAEAADVDALEGAAHLQEGKELHHAPLGGREV